MLILWNLTHSHSSQNKNQLQSLIAFVKEIPGDAKKGNQSGD